MFSWRVCVEYAEVPLEADGTDHTCSQYAPFLINRVALRVVEFYFVACEH